MPSPYLTAKHHECLIMANCLERRFILSNYYAPGSFPT